MNQSHFIETGGFPMDVNVLDRMQKAYEIFNKVGHLAGNFSIIEGCILTGSLVSNGTVFIMGEILEFRGGELGETVIIVDEPLTAEFESGAVNNIHSIRYATFGTATTTYDWSLFKTYLPLIDIQAQLDTKANQSTVTAMQADITTLQTAIATIPKVRVTTGSHQVSASSNGQNDNNFNVAYYDLSPPVGYTMSHLAGFIPSVNTMYYGGDVNSDDTMWCKAQIQATKIRVICSNSEHRERAIFNYMAIWIKF